MVNQVKTPEERLQELGIELAEPWEAVGNYVGCVRTGNLIFTSGQGVDQYHGKLGEDLTVNDGYAACRQSMINLLSVC